MDTINNTKELHVAIGLLTRKQEEEEFQLREECNTFYESLRPFNLLKVAFNEMVTAPDFKNDLMNTSLSLASGYLSKKIIIGSSNNPLKLIFGNVIQMGVTSIIAKNSEGIKTKFIDIFNNFFAKKEH